MLLLFHHLLLQIKDFLFFFYFSIFLYNICYCDYNTLAIVVIVLIFIFPFLGGFGCVKYILIYYVFCFAHFLSISLSLITLLIFCYNFSHLSFICCFLFWGKILLNKINVEMFLFLWFFSS